MITSADREAIAAPAQDAFASIPHLDAVTGPAHSATDFALAWSGLSGVETVAGMRFRIHETCAACEPELPTASGRLRLITGDYRLTTQRAASSKTQRAA